MEILWLAIVFYTLGLAAVLYLRPALMFHPDGSWKEFGYEKRLTHTMFPFWLFSIVWAFVSYALAATLVWRYMPLEATMSVGTMAMPAAMFEEEEDEDEEDTLVPVSRFQSRKARKTMQKIQKSQTVRPGFYTLDPDTQDGVRKYVYYGPERPSDIPADEIVEEESGTEN